MVVKAVGESKPPASSSTGVGSGVGDCTVVTMEKGALCGSGEISIASMPYAGEEEGIGGVVPPSHRRGGVVVPSGEDATLALLSSLA